MRLQSQEARGREDTTMALCAASIAIREAVAAGMDEERQRLAGMHAGWEVLKGLGYEVPEAVIVQMEPKPDLAAS